MIEHQKEERKASRVRQYLDLLRYVKDQGSRKGSRAVLASTGTAPDTFSVFGHQLRFDLSEGFPAVTTKRLAMESMIHELLWFIQGSTNIAYLKENKVSIWDEWADEEGNLGPVYGAQWRSWPGPDGNTFDQLAQVIEEIRRNPDSRRLVVSAWNVADIPRMKLPPCHALFQFYVADGKLSCQLYQRSADIFLGVPFNIASYALLTHLVAHVTDLQPGDFVHTFGDVHLYENHLEQATLQLSREPLPLARLELDPSVKEIDDFRREHINILDYQHHGTIRAEVAV